jgi:hypothetical protein
MRTLVFAGWIRELPGSKECVKNRKGAKPVTFPSPIDEKNALGAKRINGDNEKAKLIKCCNGL